MKKVFFSCSIAGGRDHAHIYEDIVSYIKEAGMHVLSEIFADKSLTVEDGTKHKLGKKLSDEEIRKWDLDWLNEADAVVAEVTQPSLGVGYEIAMAEMLKKPVLALFYKDSGRRLSPMIAGNPHVIVFEYSDAKETESAIVNFIKNL